MNEKNNFENVTRLVAHEPNSGDSTLARRDEAFFGDLKSETIKCKEALASLDESRETLRQKLEKISASFEVGQENSKENLQATDVQAQKMKELNELISNVNAKIEAISKNLKTDGEIMNDIVEKTGLEFYPN